MMKREKFDLDDLLDVIQMWGISRELHNASPMNQMVKLMEEVGELASALNKKSGFVFDKDVKDSIGDIFVVLVMLSLQLRVHFEECVKEAYIQIKDRKGKIVDGVFVKEQDL